MTPPDPEPTPPDAPPKPGTALQTALSSVGAATVATVATMAPGSMGVSGRLAQNVMNMSMAAVIATAFVWQMMVTHSQYSRAKDLFAGEVRDVREHNDRRFERMAERVDAMAREQQQAAVEMRRLTDAIYQTERARQNAADPAPMPRKMD